MAIRIGRRQFISALGGVAVAWPLVARAQQPKLPTIGYLGATTAAAQKQWVEAFLQRMSELGWIEGRTFAIEYRWGEDATNASPRSPPSLSSVGSISFWLVGPHPQLHPNRRPR